MIGGKVQGKGIGVVIDFIEQNAMRLRYASADVKAPATGFVIEAVACLLFDTN